jgi:ribonuclease T2
MHQRVMLFVILTWLFHASPFAYASERASGSFTAIRACDAYKSFKNGTNPGLVKTRPGAKYDIVEVNNKNWDWVRVEIPEAAEPLRWVSRECGTADITSPIDTPAPSGACNVKNQHDSYVLAMSWQPGFCEHFPYKGKKPECDALGKSEIQISHLTLHGLWPNKKQCGISYGNCGGPDLNLEEDTVSKIATWMPNFMYETKFGAYEWKKHGTCQSLEDDQYFLTAVDAVQLVNESAVGTYIREHLGRSFSAKKFVEHVKSKHGEQFAKKIMLVCSKGRYLHEVQVKLPLNFRVDAGIEAFIAGADPFTASTDRCNSDDIFVEIGGPN